MKEKTKVRIDTFSKPVLLHLVGGNKTQGGMLSYARQLVSCELPGFEQRIWKYRGYRPENDKFICLGWAKTVDVSLFTDLRSVALDFWPLYRWLRKNPATVLYAHNRPNSILAAVLRGICMAPVLAHVHTLGRRKDLYQRVWHMAGATVIYNSKLTCRYFGDSVETAHIQEPSIQWPKRPISGEGRLVACGAIQEFKNFDLIIDAFNLAGEAAPRSLHIYGLSSEPFEPAYQQRIIDKAKQNPRIHLHPWDERWTDQLQYEDIFIHARDKEPFGIVMLEAFAKGCRMVVPRPTFLDDLSHDGIFFAELTPESLAERMAQAKSYMPRQNLWEARRVFENRYSIQSNIQQLQAVLLSVTQDDSRFMGVKEASQVSL